ncbi:MAG: formamidopyrimidine-DNA glycosylase [Nitrospirales bacterium]|nr:MAG: formamidopyrimidine-DNA glycosylase [Nitrospirales bacterium]
MPELPEVEVILNQLRVHIGGSTIHEFHIRRSDIIQTGLSTHHWYRGSRITDITRKGKSLIFTCTKNQDIRYMVAELGMTGLFLFHSASAGYHKHIHLTFTFPSSHESTLHYWNPRRFGRVYLFDAEHVHQFTQRRFGVDPLSLSQENFYDRIHRTRGRLKAFLLNQHNLAGIGNIYANEILYDARIHPHTQGCRLSKAAIARLYDSMHTILRKAIRSGGSSIRDFRAPDGTRGQYQKQHVIYQKTGRPCVRGCPTTIRRLVTERRSFYCPMCQKRR